MIASVEHGYLIDRALSGMEDPKNWGIQVVALGEGRSGTELLQEQWSLRCSDRQRSGCTCRVERVGDTVLHSGSGYCGKGHKEYVKVSSGGPT
jgi:TldD protein